MTGYIKEVLQSSTLREASQHTEKYIMNQKFADKNVHFLIQEQSLLNWSYDKLGLGWFPLLFHAVLY